MTSLEFSNNGKYILVGCATNVHYVLEAFTLQIVARLEGHAPLGFISRGVTRSGAEVCWTPDSSYVLAGTLLGDSQGVLADIMHPGCASRRTRW
jgi:COMPASS component SWD2